MAFGCPHPRLGPNLGAYRPGRRLIGCARCQACLRAGLTQGPIGVLLRWMNDMIRASSLTRVVVSTASAQGGNELLLQTGIAAALGL